MNKHDVEYPARLYQEDLGPIISEISISGDNSMTKLRFVLVAVLMTTVGLTCLSKLHAQSMSTTATLSGTVSDPSGARIPKAAVKLTDPEIGITRIFTTGSAGEFSFALLPVGTYTLVASAPGFKTTKQPGIVLNVGDSLVENVGLTIGASEQVTVTTSGPLLQTQDANVGTEVASKQIEELPLNLRNVVGFVTLNSSVNNQVQQQLLASGGSEDTADQDISFLTFGGGYFGTNLFLLDGTWDVGGSWGGIPYVPAVDDTAEFKIMNNSFSAEYGWSTSNVVNIITKSGTSHFHVVLDEFMRNDKMDADLYFNKLASPRIGTPADHRNQFGAAGGGPLYIPGVYKQRNKTFFYANYEGLRLTAAGSQSLIVPTTAQLTGDFSADLGSVNLGNDCLGRPVYAGEIYDPNTTRTPTTGGCAGITIRDPYPSNKVNLGAYGIDSRAKIFATGHYWPAPTNSTAAVGSFNFSAQASAPTTSNEWGIRIDHHFNDTNSIFGRYSNKHESKEQTAPIYGNDIAGPGNLDPNNRMSAVLGVSHIFSPSFLLSGSLGFTRWTGGNSVQGSPFKPSSLGLPGILDTDTPQFPQLTFPGSYAPLGATQNSGEAEFPQNTGSAGLDLNKTLGAHSISFGYMGIWVTQDGGRIAPTRFNFSSAMTAGPYPTAANAQTGNPFASFMAGAGIGGTGAAGSTGFNAFPATTFYMHGVYIQDDWKVTKNVTLNLGLRYEIEHPDTARHDEQAYFDFHALNPISVAVGVPVNGAIVYNSPGNRDLYRSNWEDIAPRIGFAYSATSKLVVRGGWGLYYSQNYSGNGPAPGYTTSTSWTSSLDGVTLTNPLANAFSGGVRAVTGNSQGGLTNVGQSQIGVNPVRPDPKTMQYMFGLQYAFTPNDLLDVSYIGNRGRHMLLGSSVFNNGMNYGQLNPRYLTSMTQAQLNAHVTNPFNDALMAHLGLSPMACENADGTLPAAQMLEPYPEYCGGAVAIGEPVGQSNYNSFQATFTHRTTLGLIFMASFTYSKFLDDVGGPEEWASVNSQFDSVGNIRNYYDLKADWGVDATDIPHSLVLNYVYELPVGKGKKFGGRMNSVEDAVAGGWQISGITHVQAGFPLGIGASANNSTLWGGNQHANYVTGVSPKSGNCPNGQAVKTGQCWFNIKAFSQAGPGDFGSTPRYMSNLRAPGYVDEDFAIQKWFNIPEKFRLQFTAQMFNAFNHPNFSCPDVGLTDSIAGQLTSTVGARQMQLSLKLVR